MKPRMAKPDHGQKQITVLFLDGLEGDRQVKTTSVPNARASVRAMQEPEASSLLKSVARRSAARNATKIIGELQTRSPQSGEPHRFSTGC